MKQPPLLTFLSGIGSRSHQIPDNFQEKHWGSHGFHFLAQTCRKKSILHL